MTRITVETTVDLAAPIFDFKKLESDLIVLVDDVNDETLKDFDATKATFSDHSQFDFDVQNAKRQGNSIVAGTETDNENYVRLDEGTNNHVVGRNRQLMSFRPNYRAKTSPRRLGSTSGGASGDRVVARGPWTVSGIEPREFAITISKNREKDLFKGIDKIIEETTK